MGTRRRRGCGHGLGLATRLWRGFGVDTWRGHGLGFPWSGSRLGLPGNGRGLSWRGSRRGAGAGLAEDLESLPGVDNESRLSRRQPRLLQVLKNAQRAHSSFPKVNYPLHKC